MSKELKFACGLVVILALLSLAIFVGKSKSESDSSMVYTKSKRFTIESFFVSDGTLDGGAIEIITDTETGVKYLFRDSNRAGGMCPLVETKSEEKWDEK